MSTTHITTLEAEHSTTYEDFVTYHRRYADLPTDGEIRTLRIPGVGRRRCTALAQDLPRVKTRTRPIPEWADPDGDFWQAYRCFWRQGCWEVTR